MKPSCLRHASFGPLLAVWVLGCGSSPPVAPDAAPPRDAFGPCQASGDGDAPAGGALVSGRYQLSWTPPCALGAINPLASDELLDLDVAAGTATFTDRDGGCVECAAVHHGTVAGACLHVAATTAGATKVLDAYALCTTPTGVSAVQIWSGYPGLPAAAAWKLTGVAE